MGLKPPYLFRSQLGMEVHGFPAGPIPVRTVIYRGLTAFPDDNDCRGDDPHRSLLGFGFISSATQGCAHYSSAQTKWIPTKKTVTLLNEF